MLSGAPPDLAELLHRDEGGKSFSVIVKVESLWSHGCDRGEAFVGGFWRVFLLYAGMDWKEEDDRVGWGRHVSG